MLVDGERREFVKERMLRRLSQEDVAHLLGTTRCTLANIETGRVRNTRKNIERKMRDLLAEWHKSPKVQALGGVPILVADHICCVCGNRTAGVNQGASWCMCCGKNLSL